jgi:hypothetical protein
MKMTWRQAAGVGCAAVLAFSIYATVQAQQPPAGGIQQAGAGTGPQPKVVVAGENPAVRKLDKEGGKAVTNANFFRVHWSPAGSGAVCYLDVTDQGANNLRIAIYDNEKVLDYVTKDLMSSLMPTFNVPAYAPHKGTITQSGDGINERRETCKSERYNVELIWKGMGEARWVDIKMGPTTLMNFVMVPASGGEILINGKSAPGTWYPTGGGIGTGAYLALNETWRR